MLLFYHNRNAITELQQTWCNRMMVADNNQASSPILSCQLSRYQPFLLDKILEVSWGNDLPYGPLLRACCIFSFLSQPVQVTEAQVRDDQWAMPYQLEEWSVPCLGTVLELKELELWDSKIKDLGFERYPVLQRLEYLCLSLLQIDQFSSSFGIINLLDIFGSTGLYWIEEFNGILNSQKSDST